MKKLCLLVLMLLVGLMACEKRVDGSEVRSALSSLKTTYENRRQMYGTLENFTIEDVAKETKLSKDVKKWWDFEAIGYPPKKLVATSTSKYPAGKNKQVIIDLEGERDGYDEGYAED